MHLESLNENSERVAKSLLGKTFVVKHLNRLNKPVGHQHFVITETEYYCASDPASHAYQYKRTLRNESMYLPAGYLYIYLIYGMYYCLNIVTSVKGEPAAVLIRGCVPLDDIELCFLNRGRKDAVSRICNGPGKVCQAMKINTDWDGVNLLQNSYIDLIDQNVIFNEVQTAKRVGISMAKEKKWRFILRKFELKGQSFLYQSLVNV